MNQQTNPTDHLPGRFGELLTHLHRGGSFGFWCWESVARDAQNQDYPAERRSAWWPCDAPGLLPPLEGRYGHNHVWFGVHPCAAIPPTSAKGKALPAKYLRSQEAYIAAINCLYAEFDGKDFGGKEEAGKHINALPLEPTVIIDSGGGYHTYWLLDETWELTDENRIEARALQHAWVACVGGDGGAKNLNRVLRVPGSRNFKPHYEKNGSYPEVKFIRYSDKTYPLQDLRKAIPTEALERADRGDARPADLDDFARAGTLIKMLSPSRRENYSDWLAVGMSLAGLGHVGLGIWDDWSRGGSTYKPGECDKKWRTFKEGGCGFGSLVTWAREDNPGEFDRVYGRQSKHTITGTGMLQPIAPPSPSPAKVNSKLLCRGVDDEGNAEAVHLLYGNQFVFCDVYGWLHWCGTHWQRHGAERKLERAVVETLIRRRKAAVALGNEGIVKSARPKATNVRNAMFLFKSKVEVHVDDFDKDPDLLNCANGTIHLPSGELRKHNPADRLTYCTKIQLKLDADDTEWVNFLRGAVAQADTPGELADEMLTYLQKCCGYSLSGNTSEEVLWYIYGPPRSGKGTFTETLYEILGVPLSTEVDFTTFTRDRDNDANNFDLAPLKPARLVFASESERHQRLNGAKVKSLTGGNMVRCSFKGKDHFSYRPQYKIWLSSNHLPNGDPDDDALWGRLRLVIFPNSHLGTEDKGLKQRMRSRENLEGVLAWAVRGAQDWYSDRDTGLATPGAVKEQTKAARDEVDTVGQWVSECLTSTGVNEHILTNADLYQGYLNWCDDNGVTPKKKTGLTRALKAKGIKQDPKPRKIGGKATRVWPGLQWQG